MPPTRKRDILPYTEELVSGGGEDKGTRRSALTVPLAADCFLEFAEWPYWRLTRIVVLLRISSEGLT